MKNVLILIAAISFLIFGGACMTPLLYESKPSYQTYQEKVSTILITEDGKQLIVVGNEYHYIFPVNDTLKFITEWSEKEHVKAIFPHFKVENDQSLSGAYSLHIYNSDDFSFKTNKLLVSKGFVKRKFNTMLSYRGELQGKRYLANAFEVPATLRLNEEYNVTITEEQEPIFASEVAKRIVLTPLAVAADGAMILGGIPLLVIGFVLSPFL